MGNFLDNLGAAFVDAFDSEYRNAQTGSRAINLPEGKYQWVVTEVKIIDRGNGQVEGLREDQYYDYTLVIQLKVLDGQCKDAITNKYNGICLANVSRIKADLSAMGHEFEGLEKLVGDIEDGSMIGLIMDGKVTVKHKGEKTYTNIWLDRCSGKMKLPDNTSAFVREDEDDLPWGN